VDNVEALAEGTVESRVIILDVRSILLPRLMHAYNRVVGYNRRDLNERCHTVLIGDGPATLFGTENSFDVMAGLLARFRIDYHAAVFFFDPFGHYPNEERVGLRLDGRHGLPDGIPRRLAKWFKQDDLSVAEVRRYFRANSSPPAQREMKRAQRNEILQRMLMERIAEMTQSERAYSPSANDAEVQSPLPQASLSRLLPILSRQGLKVQNETLAVNLYPLFFEDWVADLMKRSESYAGRAAGWIGAPPR
jgi:DNA-binding transcriptional MerR regulator